MDIALVENNDFLSFLVYEHDWIHILYIGVTTTFFFIQLCQRISLDVRYSSKTEDTKSESVVPSLNRYPTELTPSAWSMSCIWYLVYAWQFVWIVYSIIGIFRRTSSGTYFYQHPCAMNKWCFFYSAFGLILYTPQLAAAARNKYGIGISIFRHIGTLCEVIIILVVVHISLWENLKNYLRDKFFADVWLTRLLYHNGLALWASVLYYETCLSITIGFIYSESLSLLTSCIIGGFLLLCGLISYSIIENFIFYNSLAFTFSPWITYLWLLGEIVTRSHQATSPSSTFLIWFVRYLFCTAIILACIRLCLFIWRYSKRTIPTFQSPRIHTFVNEPRPF